MGNGSDEHRALLSDFGTAAPLGDLATGATSRGYTGTVEYTAPELLEGPHENSEKSDMWSLGIVLHAMSFSTLPFSHNDPSVLKAIIRNFVQERQGLPSEDALTWLPHDPSGRLGSLRFVNAALLDFNPHRRPTTTELLENPKFRVEPITEKNEQDRATLNRRGHWRRMAVRAEQHNDSDVERQGHLTQPHLWPQRQKKRRVRFSNGHKPV